MTSSAIVRPARRSDISALVALRGEMFEAMGAPAGDPTWRDNAGAWFRDRLDDPAFRIVVVEVDDDVVACAMGAIRDAAPSPSVPDGRDVLISTVCTRPDSRGRGHARRAFDAVMEWARAQGIGRAELMATPAGRSMYESAGFVETRFPALRCRL